MAISGEARLQESVHAGGIIVISAVTYAEMRFGAIGPKASPSLIGMIGTFVRRLDGILPWDSAAVDATAAIKAELGRLGTPVGHNDAAIAGHAIAAGCILVSNNTREFMRVPGLRLEDWGGLACGLAAVGDLQAYRGMMV